MSKVEELYVIMLGHPSNTGKSEVFTTTSVSSYDSLMAQIVADQSIINDVRELLTKYSIKVKASYSNWIYDKVNDIKSNGLKYYIFLLHLCDAHYKRGEDLFPDALIDDLIDKGIDVSISLVTGDTRFASKLNKIASFNAWDLRPREAEYAITQYIYQVCKYKAFCMPYDFFLLDFGQLGQDHGYEFATAQTFESAHFNLFDILTSYDKHNDFESEQLEKVIVEVIYALGVMHRDAKIIHYDTHTRNVVIQVRDIPDKVTDFGMDFIFDSIMKPKIIDFDLCKFKYGITMHGIKNVSVVMPDVNVDRPQVYEVDPDEMNLAFTKHAVSDIACFINSFRVTGGFNVEHPHRLLDLLSKIDLIISSYDDLISKPGQEYDMPAAYILKHLNSSN